MKTWLAAELALAVASGKDALGRFPVSSQGSVLAFTAEDKPSELRDRFHAVARARSIPFQDLPVFLIDVNSLLLDDQEHLRRLRLTISKLRPKLLILDPFVRLVSIDENSAQEVSRVLGSLRALQRDFDLAVLLVHHLRKSSSPRLGQQLRGSGDFAAWYDSGFTLFRRATTLFFTRSIAALLLLPLCAFVSNWACLLILSLNRLMLVALLNSRTFPLILSRPTSSFTSHPLAVLFLLLNCVPQCAFVRPISLRLCVILSFAGSSLVTSLVGFFP